MCMFDNKNGLDEIVRHLVQDHHYQRIGYISGPKDNQDAQERLQVFIDSMSKNGITVEEEDIRYGNFSIYSTDAVRSLIESHPDLEAIVCANDDMAFAVYAVMEEKNLTPGIDIAVTGFDNVPKSKICKIPLTTVHADASEMAYQALKLLDMPEIHDHQYTIPTKMKRRRSCGCKQEFLYDHSGQLVGTVEQEEFKQSSDYLIEQGTKAKTFLMEMRYVLREMVYYQDSDEGWMTALIRSLEKMGCYSGYFFLYDKPIKHMPSQLWVMPKTIELRASFHGNDEILYDSGERIIEISTIFDEPDITLRLHENMLVVPLFYREKQYGFLFAETEPINLQFIFQMTIQISSSLEMVFIQKMNQQIQQELKRASLAKSQFLANMSHEIRTPINAILGMNEMILRENNQPDIEIYARDIKAATNALLSIVNDILDFTKIEENKMKLTMVEYYLKDMVDSVINQVSYRLEDKKLKFHLHLNENLPSKLYGDDIRIRQILLNLLTNAIKYTEKGSVTLEVDGTSDGNIANLTFSVKDTGMGIKEEDLKQLFEKFVRIDEKRNRNIEGTGLGMNIVAGLLRLMESELKVESTYNVGSDFSFELKQKVINKNPIMEMKKTSTGNGQNKKYVQRFRAPLAHILLVDDNALNRVLIKRLLKNTGILIDEAENGQICLDKMEKTSYDLILLDHMMPIMDGMETISHIQEKEGYKKGKPPIIALTANAIMGVEKEYLQAGFDAYLSKPVMPNSLDDLLIELLPQDKVILLETEHLRDESNVVN